MLLTFLSRLMSSLLTTLLFVTVVGATANQTILNTPYIEHKLESQKAYDRLSDALSKDISNNADQAAIPQSEVSTQLKQVLTPEVLRTKINQTLAQLQAYYRGNGPVPTIDISDLVAQAQASGVPLDAGKYNQPVELTAATKAKTVSDIAKYVSIGTLIIIGLLLIGVTAIAIKRRDLRPLANIVFSLGIMLSLTGGLLLLVPRLFSNFYKFDPVTNSFGALAHDLAVSTIHDFGLRLIIPGMTALLLGGLAKYALRGKHRKNPRHNGPSERRSRSQLQTQPDAVVDSMPTNQTNAEPQSTFSTQQPIEAPNNDYQPTASSDSPLSQSDVTPGAPPSPTQRPKPKPRKIQL